MFGLDYDIENLSDDAHGISEPCLKNKTFRGFLFMLDSFFYDRSF